MLLIYIILMIIIINVNFKYLIFLKEFLDVFIVRFVVSFFIFGILFCGIGLIYDKFYI